MNVDLCWFDVSEWNSQFPGKQPVHMLDVRPQRRDDSPFLVAQPGAKFEYRIPGSLLDPSPTWTLTRIGDAVRIPLYAYRTHGIDTPAWLAGHALELGLRAALALREQTSARVKRTVLVVGRQIDVVNDAGFRLYLGLAFELET